MTPAARIQAAIELLDAIVVATRDNGPAADVLISRWFGTRRYAGSKDRRAVRELVYDAIRLCGERPTSGRAAMLALAGARPELATGFDGSQYGALPIADDESVAPHGVAPAWLIARLAGSGVDAAEQAALLDRAPLDVRVNVLKGTITAVQRELGGERIPTLPDALRLPSDTRVEDSAARRDGAVEVQDAGSQIVALVTDARPGMTVIDLCAGGGGKTLALAAAMANEGRIVASDTDRARLSKLPPRAARAGVTIAETALLDPGREAETLADLRDAADVVLIDAPCSGTGTWRRNPEARWRLTPERLARLVETQARLLGIGATLVRPGGTLTYVVCSLLDEEGAVQVAAFLAAHQQFSADALHLPAGRAHGPGVRLTPASDGTDGFFVARLVRAC